MRVASSSVAQEWPWRHGPLAVWKSFRRRLSDVRFWAIQVMVAGVTALHYTVESVPVDESISTVHHIPVILYLIPVVYASLYYGWEGGVLTAVWSGLLTVPSIAISHASDFHWAGEAGQVGVTVAVGVVLAWRVKAEAEQRQRAERTSGELAVSEEKYRSLFENAGDPILVCDPDGTIVAANQALSDLGGPGSNPAGTAASDLFGEEGARLLTTVGRTSGEHLRLILKRADGSTALIDAACTLLQGPGGPTVQAVLRDVTEQEQKHEAMRSYVREVTKAQEEERTRIARELHDETAQSLVLLRRVLDLAGDNGARLDEVRGLTDTILEGVRRFSRDLRPSVLDHLGLQPAIESIAADVSERGVVTASVEVTGTTRRLAPEEELVVFRIAQEALRNAEKHAGECNATIRLAFAEDRVQLTATDDGVGFEIDRAQSAEAGRLGLLGMKERAELLGAEFSIDSRPGAGTTVDLILWEPNSDRYTAME